MQTLEKKTAATQADQWPNVTRIKVLFLCFLAVVLDGYDTAAIGFVAPAIANDLGLPAAALTAAFVATSIGAVLGFIAAGPLCERWGHRLVIIASVAWFGAGSLLTTYAGSIGELAAFRLVTALALGAAVPSAITLASEYATNRHKELAATVVATGFGVGVVFGGLASKLLLAKYAWPSIFLVGGAVPIALLTVFWIWLPQSLHFAMTRQLRALERAAPADNGAVVPAGASSAIRVLTGDLRRSTILLWTFAFLIFMDTYLFTFWTPILLTSYNFSIAEAAIGPSAFGAGALVGAVLAMPAITRFGVARVLVVTSIVGALFVAALGLLELPRPWILVMLGGAGAGMAFGNIGLSATAVSIYAPQLRASGVGWSSAVGRLGAIAGPAIGGGLLYLQWPARQVILMACIPAVAAALVMLTLSRRLSLIQRTDAVPSPK